MSLSAGAKLGPYEIVSQLGAGGMGVVYQARDPRLKRAVAIKLLPPDLTRDGTAKQRFLQEARAASALDHPNICTIHEINEADDGQLYLVMAHYEGETLRERIARGPLELNDAIEIATQVGEGLAKAHAAGIIHRDIKPANLMVTTDGTVKILDFGLAKLAGSEGVTQTGTTVGTVAYMSPEQAKGEEVDHRTDVWSLGVVLYEMLAGEPPFQGENLLAISNAITRGDPAPLAAVSSSVQTVVTTALNKDQAQRYKAVGGLLQDLCAGSAPTAVASPTPAQDDIPSIAVLPFADMSPAKDQDYFCEGLAEELIDALARLDGLRVAARTSAFQFQGKGHDLAEVGAKLRVGTILEGSVRKAGNRLRINAQLINVGDGYHLWSERYDRDLDDIFAVQDEIARAVVDKLKVKLLTPADEPLVTRPIDNLEAYDLYLEGRHYLPRYTAESLAKALECFEKALVLEPTYARAHAFIAHVHISRATLYLAASRQVIPEARAAALRAVAADEEVGEAHFALAQVLWYYEWDLVGSEREHRRALALLPGDVLVRSSYANLLAQQGRVDEGIAEARSAIERDPLNPNSRTVLGMVWVTARRFEEAIATMRAGLGLDPSHFYYHAFLGMAFSALGRHQEAVEACQQAATVAPEMPMAQACLGAALGLAGHRSEAIAIANDLKKRERQGEVDGFCLAQISAGLGNYDQAIAWLQQAAEQREALLAIFKAFPVFDPLRVDPRFQALLQRMNFPVPPQD